MSTQATEPGMTRLAPELTDQTNYLPRQQVIIVFLTCATVGMTGLIDETTVAVALPIISSALNAGNNISWVANAYFVTSTACQMLYGRISDIWSRKSVLLAMLFLFFIGNLVSALSRNFAELLVFRAIVGIGGGGLSTLGQVIVSDVVSLRQRGKYQGILGASVVLAYGVGPIIGGAFAQHASWRWIFWLNLPLSTVAAVCVVLFMPLKPVHGSVKEKLLNVDFVGAVLALGATALVILSLTWAGAEYSWNSLHVLLPLTLGATTYMAFLLWEWKGAKLPLMPVYIFNNRVVVGAIITQTINGLLTVVQVFYLPTFYQMAYGYSPVKSGAMILPLTIVQTLTSTASGLVVTHTGRYRELILSGWCFWAIGLGLLATLNESSSMGKQIGYSILTGFGVGQTFQPSLVAIQGAVERREMAVITSVRSFFRNLGGTIGLAITGTIVNNILRNHLSTLHLPQAEFDEIVKNSIAARSTLQGDELEAVVFGYRRSFRVTFIILASLAAFSFVIAAVLMRNLDLKRGDDARLKVEAKEFMIKLKQKRKGNRELHGSAKEETGQRRSA